jgi:hypothetical protein
MAPGPAHYAPSSPRAVRGGSFATRDGWAPPSSSPGPAHYAPPAASSRKSPSVAIGKAPRQLHAPAGGPGPAAYRPSSLMDASKRSSPAFSLRGAHPAHPAHTPAPNAYSTVGSPQGKAYTMGARAPAGKPPVSPGPAQYTARVPTHAPAPRIMGKPRAEPVSAGPGPGKYGLEPAAPRGFTFGGKLEEKPSTHPGQTPFPSNRIFSSSLSSLRLSVSHICIT